MGRSKVRLVRLPYDVVASCKDDTSPFAQHVDRVYCSMAFDIFIGVNGPPHAIFPGLVANENEYLMGVGFGLRSVVGERWLSLGCCAHGIALFQAYFSIATAVGMGRGYISRAFASGGRKRSADATTMSF